MTSARDVLRVAASHGLGALPAEPLTLSADLLSAVLGGAEAERLVGLLDQALADGALRSDDDTAQAVGEASVRAQAWSLLVERHHLVVHQILEAADIEHRFLKGPTAAHRFYDHPGLRPFRDVDVLVRGSVLDAAAALLEAHDHRRPSPQLVAGFERRFAKSVTLRSNAGIEVDIHRTLASGPFGVASPDPLWARPAVLVNVGSAGLPALDPIAAFVHACIHAVTGTRTVTSTLRDITGAAPPAANVAETQALAAALGATACVAEACTRAIGALDLAPLTVHDLAGGPIPPRQRAWLDLYLQRPGYRQMAWATVGAVPGLGPKARYLSALARAQRAHWRLGRR